MHNYCVTRYGGDGNHRFFNERIRINHPPPVLLGVSRESRSVALEKFTLKLGRNGVKPKDWIDPIEDTVHLVCNAGGPTFGRTSGMISELRKKTRKRFKISHMMEMSGPGTACICSHALLYLKSLLVCCM
jgi:hypothetical protein